VDCVLLVCETLFSEEDTKATYNFTKLVLGKKACYLKKSYKLYKRDPYDKRLIKTIIIKLLEKENDEICGRYKEKKGFFFGCTFIKS
jgi:hypothetical protein